MDEPVAPGVVYDQVTIGRNYYNHLLIRSDYYAPLDETAPRGTPIPMVKITREEHQCLVKSVHEYTSLRRHLLDWGMPLEDLETLSLSGYPVRRGRNNTSLDSSQHAQSSPTHSDCLTAASSVQLQDSAPLTASFGLTTPSSASSVGDDYPTDTPESDPGPELPVLSVKGRLQTNKNLQLDEIRCRDRRSLQLSDLPRFTKHQDIVDAVRGGSLVEVYIRWQDRSARVSYVHGSHAASFKNHVQQFGLYIKGQRVSVDWAEFQFQIYGALAKKIKFGATRVLCLRNAVGLLNEQRIRDDMEHIHNLVIVNIKSCSHDIFVECSSILAAEFARTCMMSRIPYRDFKIESFPDGCAQHLVTRQKFTVSPAKSKSLPRRNNIYSVLTLENDGCASSEENA
ncbi:hypothetical protein BKA81DRAFT_225042 [Phyllosticta paracitricarpa]|uniref:Uncharacterized protein n=2 Tax=Phyllosticta TaxID=121621 RepID=A0ABR1MFZ1_9PEZI